jgi:hypothetical protein
MSFSGGGGGSGKGGNPPGSEHVKIFSRSVPSKAFLFLHIKVLFFPFRYVEQTSWCICYQALSIFSLASYSGSMHPQILVFSKIDPWCSFAIGLKGPNIHIYCDICGKITKTGVFYDRNCLLAQHEDTVCFLVIGRKGYLKCFET